MTALLLMATAGMMPAEEDPLPPEARRRLEQILGDWDSTWDYLNPQGQVLRTVTGTESAEWAIPGRVVELTTEVPDLDAYSKALIFYNRSEEAFYLISVDRDGDHWILSGPLDRYVLTSQPKAQADGKLMTLRITHYEEDPESFRAVMEYTVDDGATWIEGFRQKLVRKPAAAGSPQTPKSSAGIPSSAQSARTSAGRRCSPRPMPLRKSVLVSTD